MKQQFSPFDEISNIFFSIVYFNTSRPRQNGIYVRDDIFKCIFWDDRVIIALQISLELVPKAPNYNKPALNPILAQTNDRLIWWAIYAPLGLNELTAGESNLETVSGNVSGNTLRWW